jgi:glutamyl-tRNA reductase
LKEYKIIAVTHHQVPLEEVGKYHIIPEDRKQRLSALKSSLGLRELFYLSTCNRVEFLVHADAAVETDFLPRFFGAFNPAWDSKQITQACHEALFLEGDDAVKHLFHVAASLDSLVIGEREIITQVRTAYEECSKNELSGDSIRILMRKVIEAAKEVFSSTPISRNPVSVVSLAYRKLRELHIGHDARILIIGAGTTNTNMCKYLRKHGFRNFVIFNRNPERAAALAAQVGGISHPLEALHQYSGGFDVMLSCTASSDYIVDLPLYEKLCAGEQKKKVVIDLAVPCDIDPVVYANHSVHAILIESLKQAAEENRRLRRNALRQCEEIILAHLNEFRSMYRVRQIEIAMREIPEKIKEIRNHATNTVFAREMDTLDPRSREVIDQLMNYLEKKYISVPMKMAKEILLEQKEY